MGYLDTASAIEKLLALLPELSTVEELVLACSLIEAQENTDVEPKTIIRQLDQLAIEASENIDLSLEIEEVIKALCNFIGNKKGFSGNTIDYYNPQNSYLSYVLYKREGIPITLALIYMYIAPRLGLKAEGVGFPGHFLVRIYANNDLQGTPSENLTDCQPTDRQQGFLIDPFNHVILSKDECKNRLKVLYGKNYNSENYYLNAVNYTEITLRILRNLKSIFINKGEFSKVISLCDQILFIEHNSIPELLERSNALEKMQCYGAAAKDLELCINLVNKTEWQANNQVFEIDLFKVKQKLKQLRKKTIEALH